MRFSYLPYREFRVSVVQRFLKPRHRHVVVATLLASALIGVSYTMAAPVATAQYSTGQDDPYQSPYTTPTVSSAGRDRITQSINAERNAHGLNPLTLDVDFSSRTDAYALSLARRFPSGTTKDRCPTVLGTSGFRHDTGTNIAASLPGGASSSAETIGYHCSVYFDGALGHIFNDMKANRSDNANMLNRSFTHLGVSVVHSGASTFVVARFATASTSANLISSQPAAPHMEVRDLCLAGRGRVDVYLANANTTEMTYLLRDTAVGRTSSRYVKVNANEQRRTTIRLTDGLHSISAAPLTDTSKTAETPASVRCD